MALRYRSPAVFRPDCTWLASEDQADLLPALVVVAEAQPEGGFTLTSPMLPELITELDSPDEELTPTLVDALQAVLEFYEEDMRPLPVDLSQIFVWFANK